MAYQLYTSVASTALCIPFVLIDWDKHTLSPFFRHPFTHKYFVQNSGQELYPHLSHALPNLYLQLVWPNRFTFFILLSAIFTSSLLTQFTSSLTTSASFVLGSLSFSSFISFYSFLLSLPFSFST